MKRFFLHSIFFVALSLQLSAARSLAIGPVTGTTMGISPNEMELRLPLILSKALKKITLKNVVAPQFIFPDKFAEALKAKNIEPKAIFTAAEYGKLKSFVDAGGIITVELLEASGNASARLNYFDYSSGAITSAVVTAPATELVFAVAKQFLQIEAHRTALDVITPGSKIALITSLDSIAQNQFMMHFMSEGYNIASISESTGLGGADMRSMRELKSNGLSYQIPRAALEQDEIKLLTSPLGDEDEDKFTFDSVTSAHQRYIDGFENTLAESSATLRAKTGADYLLVFTEDGRKSFGRAVNLKNGNIVWQQDLFPEANSSSLADLAIALTQSLKTPPPQINADQLRLSLGGAKPGVAGQAGGLASVAILDFYDRTNSKLFGYMSSSLSQAVDSSMQNIFEFQRADSVLANSAGAAHLKTQAEAEKTSLKAFQKQTGADYLIYGEFVYDKKTKKVTIRAQAYDLVRIIPVSTQSLESPVDATLFTAIDQIAERIVKDILLLAQQ